MATPKQIQDARVRLLSTWGTYGDCGSCGWHTSVHDYEISDLDIEHALDQDAGILELPCLRKDQEGDHRGVRIYIGEPK